MFQLKSIGLTSPKSGNLLRYLAGLSVFCLACTTILAQELTVDQAYSQFLVRNPTVLAEKERLAGAQGRVRQSGVFPNPTLNYNQEGYPIGKSDASFFQDQEYLIWVSQEFELGGKREKRQQLARIQLEAEQARYEDFLRRHRLKVSQLFAETYFSVEMKALLEKALENYKRLRRIHKNRHDLGEVSGLAQLKVDSEELAYLSRLAETRRKLAGSWQELSALIMWEAADRPRLKLAETPPSEKLKLPDLIRLAMTSRPDLIGQRLAHMASEAALELEKAESVPDLNLGGGYKRYFGQDSFFLGAEIPLPFFDRREGAIQEKAAASRREGNLSTWKEVVVRSDVRRAFETYDQLHSSARQLDSAFLEKLDRVVEITGLSYEEGEATLLEYLDALRTQRDGAINYSRMRKEIHLSFLELEAATGVLLHEGTP